MNDFVVNFVLTGNSALKYIEAHWAHSWLKHTTPQSLFLLQQASKIQHGGEWRQTTPTNQVTGIELLPTYLFKVVINSHLLCSTVEASLRHIAIVLTHFGYGPVHAGTLMVSSTVRVSLSLFGTPGDKFCPLSRPRKLTVPFRPRSQQICGCVSNIATHKSLISCTQWICHAICSSRMIWMPMILQKSLCIGTNLMWDNLNILMHHILLCICNNMWKGKQDPSCHLLTLASLYIPLHTVCIFKGLKHRSRVVLFGSLCKQAEQQTSKTEAAVDGRASWEGAKRGVRCSWAWWLQTVR